MNRHVMRKFETAVRAPFSEGGYSAFGWLLVGVLVLAALAALALWPRVPRPLPAAENPMPPVAGKPGAPAARPNLATLERGWVPNVGQWDEEAAYAAPGFFGATWVTKAGELRHVLLAAGECDQEGGEAMRAPESRPEPCPSRAWVLAERFVGGRISALRGEDPWPTRVSYFLGKDPGRHRAGLSTYRRLALGEVWPGVQVFLKATQKTVEKVFVVAPGADPGQIRVALAGAQGVRLNREGELVVETGYGEVVFSRPVAWQEEEGRRRSVEVRYTLDPAGQAYGFALGEYDPNRPLYIDPTLQATYLGGGSTDHAYALAIHPTSGEVYVTGTTTSSDFPHTAGGAQENFVGSWSIWGTYPDAFVARLDASLTQILQATYLGGSRQDEAYALAIHPKTGEVYVGGWTASSDFPHTAGGAQERPRPQANAFVVRFNADLTQILQATYLGGLYRDYGQALVIHPISGEVYVAGRTESPDFPHTAGGAQENNARRGFFDAFVARLNSELTQILQATYLGGTHEDGAHALAIHPISGEVYVTGYTYSTDFPHTAGGAQGSHGGGLSDAFVARLNAHLTQILQATYLGGSDRDIVYALAIHPTSGEVYVAGWTWSTDFPGTAGGAQGSYGGGLSDAFVARLNAHLTQILQATYLGGLSTDHAYALVIHPTSGEVYVAGRTYSTDFPRTAGGAQGSYGGGLSDAFVAWLNADLTQILQATYLGGWRNDGANALAIHPTSGEVYVAGYTHSTDFPSTAGGAQENFAGGSFDAFVARLSPDLRGGHRLYLPLVVKAQ